MSSRNPEPVPTRRTAQEMWLTRPARDREAWNNFRRAAGHVIGSVDSDLQQNLDVGYTDVDALLQLSTADGQCLRMARLARAVARTPSALTRLVDRLENRALVVRTRRSRTDVLVEVTPLGLELLANAAPRILDEVEARFWSRLTPRERDTLSGICQKLLDTEEMSC